MTAAGMIDLSHRAKFRLSGPDRVRFLNGQVSQQVDQDLSEKAVTACVCDVKGRIEGVVQITASSAGESLLVDAPGELSELLFERLDRYLIADVCEWELVTEDYGLVHTLDSDAGASVPDDAWSRRSDRFGKPGWDWWIPGNSVLAETFPADDGEEIEELRILSGVPKWGKEISGGEFPAEVNLDRRAVDFHKGCYLGQEVVSRIESAGKVRRNLVLVAGPVGGDPILTGEGEWRVAEKESGKGPEFSAVITSAIFSPSQNCWVALMAIPQRLARVETRLVSAQDSSKVLKVSEFGNFPNF